jgi:hypothetical protein
VAAGRAMGKGPETLSSVLHEEYVIGVQVQLALVVSDKINDFIWINYGRES